MDKEDIEFSGAAGQRVALPIHVFARGANGLTLSYDHTASAPLLDDLRTLPKPVQRTLLSKFQLMVDAVADVHEAKERRPAYAARQSPEWQMLTSRN